MSAPVAYRCVGGPMHGRMQACQPGVTSFRVSLPGAPMVTPCLDGSTVLSKSAIGSGEYRLEYTGMHGSSLVWKP